MLRKMVVPGERIEEEESEDTEGTDTASIDDSSEPSDTDLIIDIDESSVPTLGKLERQRIENILIEVSKVKE